MNRSELIDIAKSGRSITIQLDGAEVVSTKLDLKPISAYRTARLYKIVVNDPIYGSIFFSSFSDKLGELYRGDKISLKVTVTGIGDATDRYPDPILFAKPETRKRDSISVVKPTVFEPDLTVNV